jgi:hypothetical protein
MPAEYKIVIFHQLRRELQNVGPREQPLYRSDCKSRRDEIFTHYRERYSVRRNTYYRWHAVEFGARRADAGQSRKMADDPDWAEKVRAIFHVQTQLSDYDGGRWVAAEIALEEAKRQGLAGAHELSVRNYNIWVEKLRLNQAQGVVRFQAEFANQVHQVDITGSAYLKVVEPLGSGDFILTRRPPRERISHVAREEKWRLWVIMLVDDKSRCRIGRYFVGAGESAEAVRDFLHDAWRGVVDPANVLRGLPDFLYTDNGPFAKAETTQTYLSERDGVGVTHKTHQCYRARSGGKVERSNREVKSFELPFLGLKNELRLSQLNEMFLAFHRDAGRRQHPIYKGQTREAIFIADTGERGIRLPSDAANHNAYKRYERTVGADCLFDLNNITYELPVQFRGLRVFVFKNDLGEVAVENQLTHERAAAAVWAGPDAWQHFRSYPETTMDAVSRERDPQKGVWADAKHPYADQTAALTVVPFVATQTQAAKDTPFTVAPDFADRYDALEWVLKELGMGIKPLKERYPELWAELNNLLADGLERAIIATWTAGVRENWGRKAELGGA